MPEIYQSSLPQGSPRRDDRALRASHRAAKVAAMRARIGAAPAGSLTPAERADLLLMREEEKLARDVYERLFARWGLRPFGNISGSEQAHMDMMLALLTHYGLPDPVAGLAPGAFHRPELQTLHDELVARGLAAAHEAIRVGLLIEELDIADLQAAASRTARPDSLAVYAELARGSRNHLRAFHRWLVHLGAAYTPAHLPAGLFAQIAASPHETCS
ncbi:DUF2202 domain-containing protein [Acidocella sp.]|uniref:DUF2202 domain-containing protein n=1 Tax=Acidocella sp. TaxID=50710 RepID=UPI00260FE7EF|nr:DUF2202 domain-containing protein [Acidocella sp.]